ncbi:MAG: hypothetical protein WAN05_06940 [Roseiarcus sp.]
MIGDVDPRAERTASDITATGGRSVFQETDDHYGWSTDLPHQQRLRDVMDLEIGDDTAQITKMIIARDKLAASKDIVGPNRTSHESRIQRSGLAFLSDGAQRRRGGGRAPGLQGRGLLWAKLVVAATWSTAVSAMAALRRNRSG